MSRKYIKCDSCGGHIYFGDECYEMAGRCGKYCKGSCFAAAYADVVIMNERQAENSLADVYTTRSKNSA